MSSCAKVWAQLDRDWQGLCDRTAGRAVPPSWRTVLPGRALPSPARMPYWLADLCELVGQGDDDVTAGLVYLAQTGDQAAGRVVVQALLPRLWSLSRRDHRHGLADYVSVAWVRLMSFPVRRRNRAVLVNLSLDCLKMLSREAARQRPEVVSAGLSRPGAELPLERQKPPWGGDDSVAATARYVDELLVLVGSANLVSSACLGVLRSVYYDGLSGREAALRHGISHDMVRYYCSSAIKRLRAHRHEFVEVLGGW